jgi:cytochrome P450
MQENQPVRYRPEYNLWEVFRYEDVRQVLSDYATFSVDKRHAEGLPGTLGRYDPPRHRQLRSLVSKAFTPRRIEELTPRLIQITDELLERASASGKMNVTAEFTYPLPVRAISEMIGLPPEDQERFRQWSYQLFRQFLGVGKPENNELLQYFSDLLDKRKLDPRDDLISGLLAAEENGIHLTREEIISICAELMAAGNVTTTMLLTWLLYRLCRHPEIYQALRDDPSLIPGAIEETLRYDFSAITVWRTAHHDTVFNGHEIKAGQYVVAWLAAANFDEMYFPHSTQFDIRRSPNPHLTFGHGIHVCLGYPLTRLEGRIALERIVAHFSDIRLDTENPVQYMDETGPSKLIQSLDILFTPATP